MSNVVISLVTGALAALRELAGDDNDLGNARNRLATAQDLAVRNRDALDRLPSEMFATVDHDARQLLTVCGSQDPNVALVLTVTNRVIEDLESLVVAALADERPQATEPAREGPSVAARADRLAGLVAEYGHDAARERRSSVLLLATSVLAFGGSACAAGWSVHVARNAQSEVWARSLAPLILCGATVLAGLILARSSVARGRAAREATRLQRGLSGLDAYLAPLPPAAQHLLRATLAQTLFPRLLEDNDPLRAPVWPDSDALLRVAGAFGEDHPSASSDPEAGAPSS